MNERLFLKLEEDAVHGPESGTPAGTLRAFAVPAALRGSVSQILACRETIPRGVEVRERVLPDGALRLVLNFGDAPSAGDAPDAPVMAIGARATPVLVRMRGRVEGLSIALRPGAAAALLGIPAAELAANAVPLEDLWRGHATELAERVAAAPDDAARVAVVTRALVRRAQGHRDPALRTASRAVAMLATSGGSLSVRDVAEALGVGERRLQQIFHAHVGLSPRAWRRLARMHALLRDLRRASTAGWAGLAVDHGFYDQSHLVHEFKALCGLTPADFLRRTASGSSNTAR